MWLVLSEFLADLKVIAEFPPMKKLSETLKAKDFRCVNLSLTQVEVMAYTVGYMSRYIKLERDMQWEIHFVNLAYFQEYTI